MELEFNRVGGRWVAEFEATGDFNLHVERKKRGSLALFQKSTEAGQYASESSWSDSAETIVNRDFKVGIAPKHIKVVSSSEPTMAIVTMEGAASGGSTGGAKIVPLTNQCRVTWCDYGGDINADGVELTPDENGMFYVDFPGAGVVRVFSPFLYVPDIANAVDYYQKNYIQWNKEKQCFDISPEVLATPFSLSIIV